MSKNNENILLTYKLQVLLSVDMNNRKRQGSNLN